MPVRFGADRSGSKTAPASGTPQAGYISGGVLNFRLGSSYVNSHADAKADYQENIQTDAPAEQHGCFYIFSVEYIFKGKEEAALRSSHGAGSRHGRCGQSQNGLTGHQFPGAKGRVS